MRKLTGWIAAGLLLCSVAAAVPISYRLGLNPDNTRSTSFLCIDGVGCKTPTPATLEWNNACLPNATGLYTGTAYLEAARVCLGGTAAGTATLTITTASGDDAAANGWTIASGDNLANPGSNVGSGAFYLVAEDSGSFAFSNAINWSFSTPPGGTDTTAPTKPVGLSCTLNGSNKPVCTFWSPVDPVVPGEPTSGLDSYIIARNGVDIATVAFTGAGLTLEYTNTDVGTLSPPGSCTQSGADWECTAEGDLGSTTDDFHFLYAPVNGPFYSTVQVESFEDAASSFAKAAIMGFNGLTSGNAYGNSQVRANGGSRLEYRPTAGGTRVTVGSGTYTFPMWLAAAWNPTTSTLSAYASQDGNNFVLNAEQIVALPLLNVGVGVASTSDGNPVTVQLRDLAVTDRAPISYTDSAATSGTTPTYTVRATDKWGNVSSTSAGVAIEIPSGGGGILKKWEPGNYMLLFAGDTNSVSTLLSRCDEIADEDEIKGLMFRIDWEDIESTEGNYNWSVFDQIVARCASHDKYVFALIRNRSFGGTSDAAECPVPTYVKNIGGTNQGCAASKAGGLAKEWVAAVMDREIALFAALCQRFEENPYFMGFYNEESAPGFGTVTPPDDFSFAALVAQRNRLSAAMGQACPRTNFMQSLNFPTSASYMQSMVAATLAAGVGIGGPDASPGSDGGLTTAGEVFVGTIGGVDYRGEMAAGWQIQAAGVDGKSFEEFYDITYNDLRQNFTFWPRITSGTGSDTLNWNTIVLPALRTGDYPTRTACPTNYVGCEP